MRPLKLVQHLRADADGMSERLLEKIRNSHRCNELSRRVPADKHKRYSVEVYRDLMEWMGSETDLLIEARYVDLERTRAQREGFHSANCFGPSALRAIVRLPNQFFDRALCFSLVGYQSASPHGFAYSHAV